MHRAAADTGNHDTLGWVTHCRCPHNNTCTTTTPQRQHELLALLLPSQALYLAAGDAGAETQQRTPP
jgi:hypothetical protein